MKVVKSYASVVAMLFLVAGLVMFTNLPAKAKEIVSVFVENTSANPVPVQIVGTATKTPVQFGCNITVPEGTSSSDGGAACTPIVPADQLLVIEFVSIRAIVPTNQIPLTLIQTSAPKLGGGGTIQANHHIAYNSGRMVSTGLSDQYFATHEVTMYAMGGDDIGISVSRNATTGEAIFAINYAGYLVNSL